MTSRPLTGWRLVLRTLASWDFAIAILVGVLTLVLLLSSDRGFEEYRTLAAAAIPYGITVGTAAFVALRWVTDRLKESNYGELLRSQDPEELAASMPFFLVAGAGILCSLVGLIMVLLVDELPDNLTAVALSILVLLALYVLLGTASLFMIAARHQRNSSRLQAAKETVSREARELQEARDRGQAPG